MQRRKDEMMRGEMGLAHRFIQFATRVLNSDLEPFYKKCTPLFTQDSCELQQQGQTHEQYAAFKDFIALTEEHFNAFIAREGFQDDARGFITELQRLAQKDKDRLEFELQKAIKEMQKRAELRQRSSTGGTGGETDACPEPMMLVCKPTSIAELVNYFVHFTEYETFSSMMRGRVAEMEMIKQLMSAMRDDVQATEAPGICDAQGQDAAAEAPLNFAPPDREGYGQDFPSEQAGYGLRPPPESDYTGATPSSSTVQFQASVPEGCFA